MKQTKARGMHLNRNLVIALFTALGSLELIQRPGTATYLEIAGLLCFGWVHFFVEPPKDARTMGDVYRASRQGWRTPTSAKLLTFLGLLLMSLGFYIQFH